MPDRPISELFALPRPLRSLEFFPPKDDAGVEALRATANALKKMDPDFVSVTYGAGGTTRDRTAQICDFLKRDFGFTVMPHLTCVGHTRAELGEVADRIHAGGFRNIMTLRGDPPKGETTFTPYKDGLRYASDLATLLKSQHADFCLGVAGYPERHPEAPSAEIDLQNLKTKVDAGAAFVTTQLFFDNEFYYRFVDRCRAIGITVPIVPGIMPVLSLKQIQRFTTMCGASLPGKLIKRLEAAAENSDVVETIGIDWALTQIRDLIARGAPGYHLYVLNRAKGALALAAGLAA
ncbi:MAG: methylenetetrahydrofolate reductase [NAD(P)H] [Opitutaceae bacterium]